MKYDGGGVGRCHECGAPFVKQVKFNNGNPVAIPFATCTCDEEIFEARIDQMLQKMKQRTGNRGKFSRNNTYDHTEET